MGNIESKHLVKKGEHPMQLGLGTPSKWFYSNSEGSWVDIESIKDDMSRMINARNFLLDVYVNVNHMIYADNFMAKQNLVGLTENILKAILNIQLGLTCQINLERQKSGKSFIDQQGGHYPLAWHYHYAKKVEGQELTPNQLKEQKRADSTRFFVQEAELFNRLTQTKTRISKKASAQTKTQNG